ncbi:helix-turn-helix domain-containing protein [Chryseobacterium indoltheticum]|uniref:Transcriptional regulator, contains XRE-family HTH domain n=1 Tax=Chryseobacterium indoltheticum TaxID=254 RepID=A0A381F9P3_9FLAO|nr:helix-turn-helix transcriptional regulator [Chryseobacterium indoltheticum]AZA73455.1 XRE family transcriptional regulator [Chryseobacterium indoltheticum]SIR02013.1 Transcriptional regulator, contains XRE-family HTH domain [Chryseobacterium indoltheticum]SUX43300.1 transcriptional repressor DicA [Chryseobacterium indoltheticum]
MTLGEKLKKARINKNFTQEYLAEMLNVSQKTYSNFENDKSKPGFSQVEEMATVLDMSVLDFLSGDNVTINSTNGDHSGFIYQNQLPEKLIEQYEERIKELKEQVDYWKSRSQGSK